MIIFNLLYNKYLGIIRLYIFNGEQTNYQRAAITLSWLYGTDKNALFSPSEVYRYANEEYYSGSKTSGTIINYIEDYHSGAWFATDIPVNYDPHINYNESLMLRFRIENSTKSKVNLDSEFEFRTESKTKPITINSEETYPESKFYNFIDGSHKFLSATSSEKVEDYYNKVNTALDPEKFKGHKRLQEAAEGAKKVLNGKDLKNPLRAIGAISTALGGPIGAGLGILSSFIGKSNSIATGPVELMPMISVGRGNGIGTIKGKIEFNTNATAFPLQLPGANHLYKDSTVNINGLPIYDRPLGVISLDNTPYLKYSEKEILTIINQRAGCAHSWWDGGCLTWRIKNEWEYYKLYGLYDKPNLVLNKYSDTEIISVKARLLSKHHKPYTDVEETKFITDKIENGEYELIENDKEWFVYGTKFADLSEAKKLKLAIFSSRHTFIKEEVGVADRSGGWTPPKSWSYETKNDSPKIYIQFLIALKPKDPKADQTPIIHNIT